MRVLDLRECTYRVIEGVFSLIDKNGKEISSIELKGIYPDFPKDFSSKNDQEIKRIAEENGFNLDELIHKMVSDSLAEDWYDVYLDNENIKLNINNTLINAKIEK